MPTELEELVEFLHHGNTQIRQIACENLVGFSVSEPALFKRHQLLPVRDLKLLARDYAPIAKNAMTILVNLSADEEVLKILAEDEAFLETLLAKVTNAKDSSANEVAMLLANLAKSDNIKRIISLSRNVPKSVSESPKAMDQLMDCFVKGAEGTLNKNADFDYLAYFFADVSKFDEGRAYFTTKQDYDGVVPITKLTVFTEHKSAIRRKGVASTIKNVAFDVPYHPTLFSESDVNILPYLLLPLAGPEELADEDTADMLPDLQLLPPDKERDSDNDVLTTHLETLLLLTTTREGRDRMREVKVYPIVRECHAHVEDEGVREGCDRLVQVIMRDEEGEGEATEEAIAKAKAKAIEDGKVQEEEDEKIVDDIALSPSPQATTQAKHEDEVRPCIAELLRTGYHPADLTLRVERIVDAPITINPTVPPRELPTSDDDDYDDTDTGRSRLANRRAFRLYLSDGELVIQALLRSSLHEFVVSGRLRRGGVVRVQDFEVRRARRIGGKVGQVIYLAVGWFENVKSKLSNPSALASEGNGAYKSASKRGRTFMEGQEGDQKAGPKRVKFDLGKEEDKGATPNANEFDDYDELDDFMNQSVEPTAEMGEEPESQKLEDSFGMGAESFSELTEYIAKEDQRKREKVSEKEGITSHPSSSSTLKSVSQPEVDERRPRHKTFFFTQALRPIERPLNVLSLSELVYPYKPLPKRNYLCDIFAVVSWISPNVVKRQHMPPKRDLRILDPTIEQRRPRGLQVSVFADAAGFNPPVGTIALFRSLKTHEWDGISLNAYEKDCLGREWFITDPAKLKAYDVTTMQEWWDRRVREKEKKKERESDSQINTPNT
ncbi:hypothetical protein FQN54_002483 [Arachnomyces sp. PD_36]|nr:hypothetical protein FQN54_002483 [Arachnomyces sp. PD_36]